MISVLIGFIYVALSCNGSIQAASHDVDFNQELSPLRALYTNEQLANMRLMHESMVELPSQVGYVVHRMHFQSEQRKGPQLKQVIPSSGEDNYRVIPLSLAFALCYPYTIIEVGSELLWSGHDKFQEVIEGFRAQVVLGDLFRRSLYFRLAYDKVPYGRHCSEIISPRSMVTSVFQDRAHVLFETGAQYTTKYSKTHGAVVYCDSVDKNVSCPDTGSATLLFNCEHNRSISLAWRDRLHLDHFILGGGVGKKEGGHLYNLYSQLHFTNFLTWSVEWVFLSIQQNLFDRYDARDLRPYALHIEGMKYSKPKQWLGHPLQLGIIWGYEYGDRILKLERPSYEVSIRNVFLAGKASFWNKRIQCAIGSQWNLVAQRLELLGKASVFI